MDADGKYGFPETEYQLDWLKGILNGRKCQKPDSTDVAEQIKLVYKTNCSRKKNFDRRIPTSVPKKVFANREKPFFSQKTRTSRFGTKQVEKVYRRTPPYLTYIGDSIDQGATRLGGYRSVYVCRWGLPFFSWLYYQHKLKKFVTAFLCKSKLFLHKKMPKTFQIYS